MKLYKKLRGLLLHRKPPLNKVCQDIDNFNFSNSIYVFLIGFSYDTPTKQTFTWIKDILSKSNKQQQILRFHDGNFRKTDLVTALNNKLARIEIFCGHGEIDGLNGPPYFTNNPHILKNRHSIIYDIGMIEPGPSHMFAFCCSAGESFGRVFASVKGNSFIGFDGELSFPTKLYNDLKYIFQIMAKDIIHKGKIGKEHEEMFIREIDELIEKYEDSDIMGAYLLEYKNLFKIYI